MARAEEIDEQLLLAHDTVFPTMRPEAPELRIGPEPGQRIIRHRSDRVVPSEALVKGLRPVAHCVLLKSGGRCCGRRVAVLYFLRDYFACRDCHGLAYESQQEPIRMRGLLKAQKILVRLGAKPDVLDFFPEKPPGMHWRTYQRLHRAYEIAKDRSLRGVLGRVPS